MEKIKVLAIGDPHFKVSNVVEIDKMCQAILGKAKEINPDFIVVLGDILDKFASAHTTPLTNANKFLKNLMKISTTYVLIGNHDLQNNKQFLSKVHAFTGLKGWTPKLQIIDKVKSFTHKNIFFTFTPYVPKGRFVEALNTCDNWIDSCCIFAHQEFKGCKMGAFTSVDGDEWPFEYPFVISGHIHDYQEPQKNILYTGTPIQHAFGDRSDKTISYFEFQENVKGPILHERIDLNLPKKIIARISYDQINDYQPPKDDHVKIIINCNYSQSKTVMAHPKVLEWKNYGVFVTSKHSKSDNQTIIQITENKKFSQVFYKKIKKKKELECLYCDMFGKPQQINKYPKSQNIKLKEENKIIDQQLLNIQKQLPQQLQRQKKVKLKIIKHR